MTFFDILEALTIGPLKLVFETIFSIANRVMGHPGLAIIALSLVMNILVLPLYRRADAMQEESRDTEARLHKGVAHIKKAFSGDERMMILQTYYRQNHYRPTDALSGSVSLLLEIPFFMAAYQFLAHAEILNGVALGPIRDLGAPDGLLVIGGLAINLLPILMTAINCVSSALYLKGFPLKTKIQLYGMALFFLVFLYNSPSGLVFYWTLNNLFSLGKTIFYKLKNPRKALRYLAFAAGAAISVYGTFLYHPPYIRRKFCLIALGLLLTLPMLSSILARRIPLTIRRQTSPAVSEPRIFWLSALFLTVLTGVLIPSAVIVSSPQEFVDVSHFYHPLNYIASSACMAAGVFLVWIGVFYRLATPRGRVLFQQLAWILCGVMLVNYLFFGTSLGTLSATLKYENGMSFPLWEQVLNLLILTAVALILYLLLRRFRRGTVTIVITALIAIVSMSVVNMFQINASIGSLSTSGSSAEDISLPISKTGKNVVVIMLDRAMGEYIPYLFNEKPELVDKFDGFTHYSNTISFGGHTNFATPALFGGYEYTPVELNRRNSESLVSKHNEALKVMPTLFADSGSRVTICDPVYAGYQWIPDLSIYDDDPRIQAYITKGAFIGDEAMASTISSRTRNFFLFSITKSVPLCLQKTFYNGGAYNQVVPSSIQWITSPSMSTGIPEGFQKAYQVLTNLISITDISDDSTGTFLMMTNDTTHDTALLQEPDYTPSQVVNNTQYDATHRDRFTVGGRTLRVKTPEQMSSYQCNMASLLLLADWFDYLRENDAYDNTRIILVSDHGECNEVLDEMIADHQGESVDLEGFMPLLMVKDFDAHGFETCDAFMTNADVPALAMAGVVENPVNPYTGKAINSDEKTAHEQFIIRSDAWRTQENNGNTFFAAQWASVKDNPWDLSNWSIYDKTCVLDRHAAP